MIKSLRFALLLGFGTLLVLNGVIAMSAFLRARRIYEEVLSIHDANRQSSAILENIRTDIYRIALLVRDYIIDPDVDVEDRAQYQASLAEMRSGTESLIAELDSNMDDKATLFRLRGEIASYMFTRGSVLQWSDQEKTRRGFSFLREEALPRREAIISLTREIDKLNSESLLREEQRIAQSQKEFRRYLGWMFAGTLVVSVLVAGASFTHISWLERRSQRERRRVEQAERELRSLSQKLVHAQEDERKALSRELHDEIGQMITGLRLELRNLGDLRHSPGADFDSHLAETKELTETALRAVRDLAMGLRPSMLDDLGLAPALEWKAREFSRHNGIPATVEIDGNLEDLSEDLRTCVFRVVQESLTNIARHAQARNVRIAVHGGLHDLALSIHDDGIGFESSGNSNKGIGLIGMEERVRQLKGIISISSRPNKGTLLEISIPLQGPSEPG